MRSLLLLMRRNVRKRPGQIAAMALLIAITAALINLGYLLGASFGDNFDTKLERANAADAVYVVPAGPAADQFVEQLRADPRVTDLEADQVLYGVATYTLSGSETTTGVLVTRRGETTQLNRAHDVEVSHEPVADPVWAARILSSSGSYRLGDRLTLTAGSRQVTFGIQGFIEEVYTATPQMGTIGLEAPADAWPTLEETGVFAPAVAVKVRGSGRADISPALDEAIAAVQESSLPGADRFTPLWGQQLDLMRSGSMIGANIFAVAFIAFAVVIVAVTVIVLRFLIKNLITADMTAIGTMRAVGLTTGHVIAQVAGTYGATALIAALLGVGLSYLALPGLAASLAAQTGLGWEPGFSAPALALSVGLVTLSLLGFAIISALRVRSVTTVAALRGGIATHSFRHNHVPLDRGRVGVNVALGLKSLTQRPSQTAVMALTVAAVTFASVFAVGMTTNLLANPAAFARMVIGDVEDVGLMLAPDADAEATLGELRTIPGVEQAFFSTVEGATVNGRAAALQIVDDFAVLRYDAIYTGRMPQHDNEAAIGGKFAEQLGLQVGDTWTADLNSRSVDYLITGLTSSSRGLGSSVALTTEGYQRIDPNFRQRFVALYVTPDTDPETVIEVVKANHGAEVAMVVNGAKNADSQLSGYLSMIGALAVVVLAFTVLVVVLVVALIVTTMIVQSRRELGVHKAVGFTTADLTVQTLWSYLPAVAVGAVVGGIGGAIGLNPILGGMLAAIGVIRVDLVVAPWHVVALAAGVLLLAGLITLLATRRIGRISAYQLVAG